MLRPAAAVALDLAQLQLRLLQPRAQLQRLRGGGGEGSGGGNRTGWRVSMQGCRVSRAHLILVYLMVDRERLQRA